MLFIMPKIPQDKQQSIEVYGNHLFIECKIYTGQDIYTMFIFSKLPPVIDLPATSMSIPQW